MNANHSVFIGHENVMEMDICELLSSMRLEISPSKESANVAPTVLHPIDVSDVLMSEDPSYHSDGGSDRSSSSSRYNNDAPHGCAYLQAIRGQLDNFTTTNGEYLEAIFTHREILSSYPAAHHQCARGFSDIAYLLEQRAWRADRDADTEAVTAFRHEAWSIAASLPPPTKPTGPASGGRPSYVCVMPVM